MFQRETIPGHDGGEESWVSLAIEFIVRSSPPTRGKFSRWPDNLDTEYYSCTGGASGQTLAWAAANLAVLAQRLDNIGTPKIKVNQT